MSLVDELHLESLGAQSALDRLREAYLILHEERPHDGLGWHVMP